MNKFLDFFKNQGVSLQITLDSGKRPTVHAQLMGEKGLELHKTEGSTMEAALLNMKFKLFGKL